MVSVPPRTCADDAQQAGRSCRAAPASAARSRLFDLHVHAHASGRHPTTWRAISIAERIGRLILRASHIAIIAASSIVSAPPPSSTQRVCACSDAAALLRPASKLSSRRRFASAARAWRPCPACPCPAVPAPAPARSRPCLAPAPQRSPSSAPVSHPAAPFPAAPALLLPLSLSARDLPSCRKAPCPSYTQRTVPSMPRSPVPY